MQLDAARLLIYKASILLSDGVPHPMYVSNALPRYNSRLAANLLEPSKSNASGSVLRAMTG